MKFKQFSLVFLLFLSVSFADTQQTFDLNMSNPAFIWNDGVNNYTITFSNITQRVWNQTSSVIPNQSLSIATRYFMVNSTNTSVINEIYVNESATQCWMKSSLTGAITNYSASAGICNVTNFGQSWAQGSTTDLCLQNHATASTDCGAQKNASIGLAYYIGYQTYPCGTNNWNYNADNFGICADGTYLIVNYTKPIYAINAYSKKYYSGGPGWVSDLLPAACWNAYPDRIRLREYVWDSDAQFESDCWNGTSWQMLHNISGGYNWRDEAVQWTFYDSFVLWDDASPIAVPVVQTLSDRTQNTDWGDHDIFTTAGGMAYSKITGNISLNSSLVAFNYFGKVNWFSDCPSGWTCINASIACTWDCYHPNYIHDVFDFEGNVSVKSLMNKSNVITLNDTFPWTQVFANLSLQNISQVYNGTNTDTIAYNDVQFAMTCPSQFYCIGNVTNISASSTWTKVINASGDVLNETWQTVQDLDSISKVNTLAFSKKILNVTNLQYPEFNFTDVDVSDSFRSGWNCSNISTFNINSTFNHSRAVWCNKTNVIMNISGVSTIAYDTSKGYFTLGSSDNRLWLTGQIQFNNTDDSVDYNGVLFNFTDANMTLPYYDHSFSFTRNSTQYKTVAFSINLTSSIGEDGTTCVEHYSSRSFNVTSTYRTNITSALLQYGTLSTNLFKCTNESAGCLPVSDYCMVNGWTGQGFSEYGDFMRWSSTLPTGQSIYFYGYGTAPVTQGPGGAGGSAPILCPPGQYYSSSQGCIGNTLGIKPEVIGVQMLSNEKYSVILTVTNPFQQSATLRFETDVSWIGVTPSTGNIPAGKTASFQVTLTAPFKGGNYSGNLKIYSNGVVGANLPVVISVIEGNALERTPRLILGSTLGKALTDIMGIQVFTIGSRTYYLVSFIILGLFAASGILYFINLKTGAIIPAATALFLVALYSQILLGA